MRDAACPLSTRGGGGYELREPREHALLRHQERLHLRERLGQRREVARGVRVVPLQRHVRGVSQQPDRAPDVFDVQLREAVVHASAQEAQVAQQLHAVRPRRGLAEMPREAQQR